MFLLVLLGAALFSCALAGAIRKFAPLFYVLAVAIDAVYIAMAYNMIKLAPPIQSALIYLIQKCTVALGLFVVVMAVGVVSAQSPMGARLRPIRAQLSILATLLTLPHLVFYVAPFAQRAFGASLSLNLMLSLVVAAVLVVLLAMLALTSVEAIKRTMKTESWKKLQRLSYVFFGLIYVHVALMLMPSALAGGEAAINTMVVYTVVFAVYAVLRIIRWSKEKNSALL